MTKLDVPCGVDDPEEFETGHGEGWHNGGDFGSGPVLEIDDPRTARERGIPLHPPADATVEAVATELAVIGLDKNRLRDVRRGLDRRHGGIGAEAEGEKGHEGHHEGSNRFHGTDVRLFSEFFVVCFPSTACGWVRHSSSTPQ